MKRKLKDLSRHEIFNIAYDYANTSQLVSGEHFSEVYNISETTFYNVLRKAILESIVSEEIARLIAKKSAGNVQRHGGDGAQKRVLLLYENMIKERKNYKLGKIEARKWVKKYIESALYLDDFTKQNFIDSKLLKHALYDAIVYSWVTNKEVEKIIEKTKKQKIEETAKEVEESFEPLIKKRIENKKTKT